MDSATLIKTRTHKTAERVILTIFRHTKGVLLVCCLMATQLTLPLPVGLLSVDQGKIITTVWRHIILLGRLAYKSTSSWCVPGSKRVSRQYYTFLLNIERDAVTRKWGITHTKNLHLPIDNMSFHIVYAACGKKCEYWYS